MTIDPKTNKPKPLKSQPVVPSLELIREGQVFACFEITGTDLHIGRTRGSEIQFDDAKVSRNHARVERRADGIVLPGRSGQPEPQLR